MPSMRSMQNPLAPVHRAEEETPVAIINVSESQAEHAIKYLRQRWKCAFYDKMNKSLCAYPWREGRAFTQALFEESLSYKGK